MGRCAIGGGQISAQRRGGHLRKVDKRVRVEGQGAVRAEASTARPTVEVQVATALAAAVLMEGMANLRGTPTIGTEVTCRAHAKRNA